MDRWSVVIGGAFKLIVIISLPLAVLFGYLSLAGQPVLPSQQLLAEPSVLLKTPYVMRQWTDIGSVMEPVLTLPVQTVNGFERNEFVLDSGAVISSLPREWAGKIGRDLALAKRIAFKGFGNTVSFAYQSTMNLQIGTQTVALPVVFTESEGTKSLLGRKGLFDQYSIVFDHEQKIMEIKN